MCSGLQAKEVKTPPLEPEEDTSRDLSLWCLQQKFSETITLHFRELHAKNIRQQLS